MKLGTVVKLSDGRIGTVVFNSLIGVGIKWGEHNPNPDDFAGTSGNTADCAVLDDWPWEPDALLRDPWESNERYGFADEDCVGRDYETLTAHD